MAELPDIRIGTAEREDAMKRLSDHFAAGRLSVAEFDERSGVVAAAVTRGDLAEVFTDLPEPVVEKPVSLVKERRPFRVPQRFAPLVPIIAVLLFFVTHQWLVFLLIPVAFILLFGGGPGSPGDRRRSRRERRRGEGDEG
ncbi:DUF1707 SHOCT-like domain-containing protein [Nocardia huaxiensis]|uniref:DUF1707 SHOCT-like domain-containing protein n=1 Tax=Nocardia huaxiensis TaxID=2755382 RepID=UPI001E412048|nr:DUF1707 domain-containing protein [Nocardia huaxiensis]UFS95633.1 DUF1707 domain-containing protein [Nocardia huaxiensis]